MSNINYTIVGQDEFNEINKFHQSYFGNIRPLYVWDWQYGKLNPNKSVLVAAKSYNKIIATQGAMSVDLVINGQIYSTGKNESLLIEKDYRKKGVFSGLYEFAFEEYAKAGFNFIWGFTKAEGQFKKVGFSYDRIIERAVLSLGYKDAIKLAKVNKASFWKSIVLRIGVWVMSVYSSLKFHLFNWNRKRNSFYSIHNELKAEEDLITFFSKICEENKELIHINYSKEFIDWRIKKSPNKILTFYAYRNNKLCGFLLVEVGKDYSDIIDFLYSEESCANELMKVLYETIKSQKIKFVAYSGNKENDINRMVFKYLNRLGFYKIKGPNGFVLKVFRKIDASLDLKNWYITSLWYEGI